MIKPLSHPVLGPFPGAALLPLLSLPTHLVLHVLPPPHPGRRFCFCSDGADFPCLYSVLPLAFFTQVLCQDVGGFLVLPVAA